MIIINGAYYADSEIDAPKNDSNIFPTSAGHHTLISIESFKTVRPKGRRDYQILYVNKGKLYYTINESQFICDENSILIYRPFEPQFYNYYLEDFSDIFWIHFTGNAVEELLEKLQLSGERCFTLKSSGEFVHFFENIIKEFQINPPYYDEVVNLYFKQLLYAFSRNLKENQFTQTQSYFEINKAISYFNSHFNEVINMDEYVKSMNISMSWFTHLFKQQTNTTPNKYLRNLRITKAKSLLCSNISINEIAIIVGIDDPFYFSRVFRQIVGITPSEFRKQQVKLNVCPEEDVPWKSKFL